MSKCRYVKCVIVSVKIYRGALLNCCSFLQGQGGQKKVCEICMKGWMGCTHLSHITFLQLQTYPEPPKSKIFFFCKRVPQRDSVCKAAMCPRCKEHLFLHKCHFPPKERPEEVRVANKEAAKGNPPTRMSGRERKKTGVCTTAPSYPVDCNGCSHDDPDFWQPSEDRRYYLEEGRLSNNCFNCGHPV